MRTEKREWFEILGMVLLGFFIVAGLAVIAFFVFVYLAMSNSGSNK